MPAPVLPPLPPALRCAWRPHRRGEPAERIARAWLADAFGGAPDTLALARDAHGRPRLGGAQARFDVSWSHSGAHLLLALGEDVALGVDLERLRPRPRALALARRFFHPSEAGQLAALPADARELAFTRLWCAKEAVLKAHGRGLAFGLDKLRFEPRAGALALAECDAALGPANVWALHEFAPAPGYRAALAWRPRG